MSFAALIERLEKATGPDRELDAEIYRVAFNASAWSYHGNCHIGAQIRNRNWTKRREEHPDFYEEGDSILTWRYRIGDGPAAKYGELPRLTESIDAAMTLVPEDWRVNSGDFSVEGRFTWMLTLTGQPRTDWFARRRSMTDDYDGDPLHMSGRGKTLALALCIAALKSRDVTP